MDSLRFYFSPEKLILDRSKPNVRWTSPAGAFDWNTNEDYAIVARFTSPRTAQPVVVVAGISYVGTEAAAQIATSQEFLSEALHDAPENWENMNIEFVLHTKLLGDSPSRPNVVASYYW